MWHVQKTICSALLNILPTPICAIIMLGVLSSCAVKPQIGAVVVNNRLASSGIEIERDGKIIQAVEGTELKKGDIVSTGPGEEAVLRLENDRVEVTLFENTQVTISSVFLKVGELAVKVQGKLKEIFQVDTEFGVAASETTIYYVSLKGDTDIRVVGIEGVVRYYPPDNSPSVPLSARDEVTWNNNQLRENIIDRNQYNRLLNKINEVERVYKKGDARFIMPNVIGLSVSEAEDLLRREGFRVGEPNPVLSDQPLGTVVGSRPAVGKLASIKVPVVLSFAEKATVMPNVIGLNESRAVAEVSKARLKLEKIEQKITGKSGVGQVIEQSVLPGNRVAVGTKIALTVEAESVKVPDVRGMREDSARRSLQNARLKVGSVDIEYDEFARREEIKSQSSRSGSLVAPGSQIDLVIAAPGAYVPPLIGLSEYQVRREVGNTLRIYFDPNSKGEVVDQSLSPNQVVKYGSDLILYMEDTYVVE